MTFEEKCKERASALMDFTIYANQSYMVILQLRDLQENQNEIINISPAFYQTVFRTCLNTLFIDVAKMFDGNDNNESIYVLLKNMKDNLHQLHKTPVSVLRYSHIDDSSPGCADYASVDEMVNDLLDMIKQCSSESFALRTLRNKYYAHADKNSQNDLDKLFKENTVSLATIEKLLTVNANACTALYQYFFDSTTYPLTLNWNDFEKTIRCVQKYKYLSEKYNEY